MRAEEYLYNLSTRFKKDYWGHVEYARQKLIEALPVLSEHHGNRAIKILRGIIFTCMATDGCLSDTEYYFLCDLLGPENMMDIGNLSGLNEYNTDRARTMYRLYLHRYDENTRASIVGICGCAIMCDNRYSPSDAFVLNELFR